MTRPRSYLPLPEVPRLEELPDEPLVLPGLSAPPVAEPMPETPKYENTLCFQLGCERSVLASKLGADSSLLCSPLNANVSCPAPLDVLLLMFSGRRSFQGTATCLPLAPAELADPDELLVAELLPPALPRLLPEGLVALPVLLPEGLVALPVLPEAPPLSERIANSIRPELGLMMQSLIVPNCVPELLTTWAPVNWLALISC